MKLITHVDLDGVGCAVVARYLLPELKKEDVYYCNYVDVDEKVLELLKNTDEDIIITDLSVKPETALAIEQDYTGRVKLYDHHKTAELLNKFAWALVDVSQSATMTFFEEQKLLWPAINLVHIPGSLNAFVTMVNDYDLWTHALTDSIKLNDMKSMLGLDLFAEAILQRIETGSPLIMPVDHLYLKGLQDNKKRYFENREEKAQVAGNCLTVIASRYISDLAQYLRDKENMHPDWATVDYIDIVNYETETHCLRSMKPNFDVSEIAKQHGGGGHKAAAGYPMSSGV